MYASSITSNARAGSAASSRSMAARVITEPVGLFGVPTTTSFVRGVIAAINASDRPEHPADPRIAGCRHVVFHEPGRDGADAVAATSIHPGWLDRSPCGTGTSARLAQLHARGALNRGAKREEVIETILQCAPYVGFPKTNHALKAAKDVFDRWEAKKEDWKAL